VNKIVSTIILIVLGILLSTHLMSQSTNSRSITLTQNNSVLLSGPVNEKSVANVQVNLGKIAAKAPTGSIVYLLLDTPGGSVLAGNQLIDYIKGLNVTVKPVCLFCASMGYHIFQSLNERLVQESSILMSHRVSLSGVGGQIPGELITMVKFYADMSQEMDEKVAKRLGVDVKVYQASIYDELWLTGTQAVKGNHADRMAKFQCNEALLTGKRTETVETIFGPVTVTMSKCPLIQGILDFKFERVVVSPRNNVEVMTAIRKARRTLKKEY
jgi:ATP-dependent protease ClpP protease subunit